MLARISSSVSVVVRRFLRAHLDACWHTLTCPHVCTVTNSQHNFAEEREEVDVDVGSDVDLRQMQMYRKEWR